MGVRSLNRTIDSFTLRDETPMRTSQLRRLVEHRVGGLDGGVRTCRRVVA